MQFKKITFLFFILTTFTSQSQSQKQKEVLYHLQFEKADSLREKGKEKEAVKIFYSLIDHLNNADIDTKTKNYELIKNYQSLSNIYAFVNDSLSKTYANKGLQLSYLIKNDTLIQKCYSLKYYCLYYPGTAQELNLIADSCIYYAKKIDNKKQLAEAYMHKFNALIEFDSIPEGMEFCLKAENLYNQIEDELYLSVIYNNMANVYKKANLDEKALEYHQKSYEIDKKHHRLDYLVGDYKNIGDDYYRLNLFEKATEYYHLYVDSSRAYFYGIIESDFTEAEAKFNVANKDKEIALNKLEIANEKSKQNKIIFLAILLFIISLFFYIIYFNRQKKQKQYAEYELRKEKELNDLRTSFLENIAHEIRTPITLINGYLALAKEKIDHKNEVIKNIDLAKVNSQTIIDNANEIMELLKLNKGKLPIKKKDINIVDFTKRILFSFESLAEIKNLKLNYQSNINENIIVSTDDRRLEKILNNLISNAIKFSHTNSKIEFKVEIINNSFKICVTDFGVGIDKNEQDKIFKRFYQTTKGVNVGGMGIGLSLVKEFTEALNGKVNVTSNDKNGTTFCIEIPSKIKINEQESVVISDLENSEQLKKLQITVDKDISILIVEDNPQMNEYLRSVLSLYYDCTVAFDGSEALLKAQNKKYQLIISDIMMPNLDGFAFKEKLNQLPNYVNVPFIFLTAKAQSIDKIKGYNLGIDDYILKPFEKEELLCRINNLIKNKQERENWIKSNIELVNKDASVNEELLEKVKNYILNNLSNENLKVEDLANEVAYSQRQLSRILKSATGLSPIKYIAEIRLQKAFLYLSNKKYATITEVRNAVGIPSASHFNKKFFERFGKKPGEV